MVVAKSERAYSLLKQAFRDRTVRRSITPWYKDTPIRQVALLMRRLAATIGTSGRSAPMVATRLPTAETLEAMAGGSLLEVHLETGRTHQIRVHMAAAVGHPCVGDDMYGADPSLSARLGMTRQWLCSIAWI